jgi:hypothetical protein
LTENKEVVSNLFTLETNRVKTMQEKIIIINKVDDFDCQNKKVKVSPYF